MLSSSRHVVKLRAKPIEKGCSEGKQVQLVSSMEHFPAKFSINNTQSQTYIMFYEYSPWVRSNLNGICRSSFDLSDPLLCVRFLPADSSAMMGLKHLVVALI